MRLRITLLLLLPILAAATGAQSQPDLGWLDNSFWSYPLVPTNQPHTPPHVLLPQVLYGNSEVTYLNYLGFNGGDADVNGNFQVEIFADGELAFETTHIGAPLGQMYRGVDLGPITIRGGRHALTVVHDAWDQIAESNEDNNAWGRQFVWTPLSLPPGVSLIRSQPPAPTGGWDQLAVPAPAFNCDGFAFLSTTNWSGVALSSLNDTSDYDLYLYEEPAVWDDGFVISESQSVNLAGELDFALVNGQQTGVRSFNAGVTYWAGQGPFSIDHVSGNSLQPDVASDQVLDSGEFLGIFNLEIEPHEVGEMLVQIESPLSNQYALHIYHPDQAHGVPLNSQALAFPDAGGLVSLVHDFAEPGQYALVLTRDWIHGDFPLEFTIRTSTSFLDLTPAELATWHSPLVPRNAPDGTGQSVPLPATLTGGTGNTYFNQAITGLGNTTGGGVQTTVTMDGLALDSGFGFFLSYVDNLSPGGVLFTNNIGPMNIPGGRHTWVMEISTQSTVPDPDPGNNIWGEQFIWEPEPLTYGGIATGEVLALTYSDSDRITSGEPTGMICNGHRMPNSSQYWRVVAMAAEPGNELDLGLFPPSTGPKDGFQGDLALSWYSDLFVEYVLVNDNLPTLEELDVGVFRMSGESGQYWIDASTSETSFDPLAAPLGPATLGPGELIDIYDIYLGQGTHHFRLENLDGQVDWALQLHDQAQAYGSRESWFDNAVAFGNGPGQDESFQVEIINPGWYGLTVYKNQGESVLENGTYQVHVTDGVSDAGMAPSPVQAGISQASPNPFNPETTLTFAIDKAGAATVEVFDLQGSLVATLVDRNLSAGSHRMTWNGRDNQGRRVPSGVYLARLRAGSQHWSRKLMLVK